MTYLQTLYMSLVLEGDNLHLIKWWVDASYTPNQDMKSHTGASMTLGQGCPITASSKQKINTKSSTEAEVVAVDDLMGHIMWINHFIEAKGISIKNNIVHQNNEAVILLESNGRKSSVKRTKHMILIFFVRDRIENKDTFVIHYPIEDMPGDYFTKATQGKKFYKFRKLVMNLKQEQDDFAFKLDWL